MTDKNEFEENLQKIKKAKTVGALLSEMMRRDRTSGVVSKMVDHLIAQIEEPDSLFLRCAKKEASLLSNATTNTFFVDRVLTTREVACAKMMIAKSGSYKAIDYADIDTFVDQSLLNQYKLAFIHNDAKHFE